MPNSWRDHILQAFAPQVARLTLVADPASLLIEEGHPAGAPGTGL